MPGAEVVDVLSPSGSGGARLVVDAQRPTVVTEVVGDRTFAVDDDGFWQVHRQAPAVLTAAVQDALDRERLDPEGQHLDLYGGVGLLAAALADVAGPRARVTSVESAARATEHAQENLSEWIGARAETGRTVVLDPPRAGAGRDVVVSVAALQPAQVVYVACDPVALARDVATFADLGYRLEALRAFDLFPHTHHLEAVARLVPVARGRAHTASADFRSGVRS
jgi:tRNA/tmRNA/rRNA uracil-C5-methylase (TrmA/RlmC/RlmD family)